MRVLVIIFCICGGLLCCENKGETKVSQEAVDLSVMFQRGDIQESKRKEAFMDIMDELIMKRFTDAGYGYRIDECAEKWRMFEDEGHIILLGSVYEDIKTGYSFVWIWKDDPDEGIPPVYLSVGGVVVMGDKYPQGVIPY